MKKLFSHKLGVIGGTIVVILVVVSIFADVIAPYEYRVPREYEGTTEEGKTQALSPSKEHPFGTDDLRRDILSGVIYGTRISLKIAFLAVLISSVGGTILGLISGYAGGSYDMIFMRLVDIMMAFPGILLAIAIASALGAGFWSVVFAISIMNIPIFVRQVRAATITLKEKDFIYASKSLGSGHLRIMLQGLMPNIFGQVLVLVTLGLGSAVLESAALGFIGLGVDPGSPELGTMIAYNKTSYNSTPWAVIFPGITLSLLVLGFNLLGDALRDVLNPKYR